jgi:hypothetical protein
MGKRVKPTKSRPRVPRTTASKSPPNRIDPEVIKRYLKAAKEKKAKEAEAGKWSDFLAAKNWIPPYVPKDDDDVSIGGKESVTAIGNDLRNLLQQALESNAKDPLSAVAWATKFMKRCREAKITLPRLVGELVGATPQWSLFPMPWGKFQGKPLGWISEHHPSYLAWLRNRVTDLEEREPRLYEALQQAMVYQGSKPPSGGEYEQVHPTRKTRKTRIRKK